MNASTFCVKPDRNGDLQVYLADYNVCIARFSDGVDAATRKRMGELLSDLRGESAIERMAMDEYIVILDEARKTDNMLAAFEALADLYHRRSGRLAPGKDDPGRDSGSEENRARYNGWVRSGLALHDATVRLAELEAEGIANIKGTD